jgi:hypothetical protein
MKVNLRTKLFSKNGKEPIIYGNINGSKVVPKPFVHMTNDLGLSYKVHVVDLMRRTNNMSYVKKFIIYYLKTNNIHKAKSLINKLTKDELIHLLLLKYNNKIVRQQLKEKTKAELQKLAMKLPST